MERGSNSGDDAGMTALGREVGRRSVERLGTGLTRLIEETSALFRWTLTMLVLLNGAALYACVSARDTLGPELFEQLIRIFFGGIMAALLAGLAGIFLTFPVAGAIRRAITHWTDVSMSGDLSEEALSAARRVKQSGAVWLAVTTLIALTSLALFALGALMLGERYGIVGPPGNSAAAETSQLMNLDAAADDAAQALLAPANATEPQPAEPKDAAQHVLPPAPQAAAPHAAPRREERPAMAASRPAPPKAKPAQVAATSSPAPAQRPAPAAPPPSSPQRSASPAAPPPITPAPSLPTPPQPDLSSLPTLALPTGE